MKNGVEHFISSSVDRGGNERSFDNPTEIPHFISKHNIERYLVDKTKDAEMNYTILRPVAFMENWAPGSIGKGFGTTWKAIMGSEQPLQLVATSDIGKFAAVAFLKPAKYKNRAVGLAGDEVSFSQADKVFKKKKTGHRAPANFTILGYAMAWGLEEMGIMFSGFKTKGYGVKIQDVKKGHPGMLSLTDWIEKKSGYVNVKK